jgi:hypothetical protein
MSSSWQVGLFERYGHRELCLHCWLMNSLPAGAEQLAALQLACEQQVAKAPCMMHADGAASTVV